MSYEMKLTLHIPLYSWNGELTPIDAESFKEKLIARFKVIGIDSFYFTSATGYYKGRGYNEALLTVFCEKDKAERVVEIFKQVYNENNHIMKQESFAYEMNGVLYVVELK